VNDDFHMIFNHYQANNGAGKPAELSLSGNNLGFSALSRKV
jgi:hypothetical protein